MSMRTSEQRSNRAQRVQMLLDELEYDDLTGQLRKDLLEGIASSEPHEQQKRDANYRAVWALDQITGHIRGILISGKFAKIELNRKKK